MPLALLPLPTPPLLSSWSGIFFNTVSFLERNFEKLLLTEKQGDHSKDNLRTVFEMKFLGENLLRFFKVGLGETTRLAISSFKFSIRKPSSQEIESTSEWKKFSHLLHILLGS